jgi:hypothetical protein
MGSGPIRWQGEFPSRTLQVGKRREEIAGESWVTADWGREINIGVKPY